MRLLIESRKLTIELASNKHSAADNPRADTLASDTASKDPHIDIEPLSSSADNKDSAKSSGQSIYRYTQLSRRKSIHKRIGRLFLRISQMCSDAQCSAYAYQYGCGISELPAGEPRTEGTTSFHEMPGSFPRFELEQPDMQQQMASCRPTGLGYSQTVPEHLRDYYKANQNATTRRAAVMSATNLPQLPRLEVPESTHRVPRLISDHYSASPSPISPITPVLDATNAHVQTPNSQLYLDTISPCMIPKEGNIYAHYGSWGHYAQQSPAPPSTANSYGSSHATTPLSAHPSSAHTSLYSWPQLQPGQLPSMYSQEYLPVGHSQSTNDAMAAQATPWLGNLNGQCFNISNTFPVAHTQDYQADVPADFRHHSTPPQAQSCFEKQSQLATTQLRPTSSQLSHTYNDAPYNETPYNDAPPAYSPVVPDPQVPTTIPRPRYQPAECKQCGKIFTGKYGPGNCKRHVQQTHGSIVDRAIHMCKVCMKTYNRADALRKHSWKKHRQEDARPNKRRR